jgi:hypothetical protein
MRILLLIYSHQLTIFFGMSTSSITFSFCFIFINDIKLNTETPVSSVIVKASSGPRYVVGCRSKVDKEKLTSGTRVVLDMTTLTIMRTLPREVCLSVTLCIFLHRFLVFFSVEEQLFSMWKNVF